jgi:hypothetical protein
VGSSAFDFRGLAVHDVSELDEAVVEEMVHFGYNCDGLLRDVQSLSTNRRAAVYRMLRRKRTTAEAADRQRPLPVGQCPSDVVLGLVRPIRRSTDPARLRSVIKARAHVVMPRLQKNPAVPAPVPKPPAAATRK